MTEQLNILYKKVHNQKNLVPSLYGKVDFNVVPERFARSPDDVSEAGKGQEKRRAELLKDYDKLERYSLYTMLGDTVADAYAALTPKYGFRPLIDMLTKACDHGIESVENPPPELVNFITAMEKTPSWLDMGLVEKGARITRIQMAIQVPYVIRGVFIYTFANMYSGLPMALTGALAGDASARRVQETSSFFTTASLPGALKRNGVGFKAAAMVRLMHSMVRFNLLTRSEKWNLDTHGIPIPQIDQMPAGMVPAIMAAGNAIKRKNKKFTKNERAVVEFCRYQSYLLGLPEDLLPGTPKEIIDVISSYFATLRYGYDDETCGELARATMAAYRPADKKLRSRIFNSFEKSFSLVFFERLLPGTGGVATTKKMRIKATSMDYLKFLIVGTYLVPQVAAHIVASKLPIANSLADKLLVKQINRLLVSYGHAEYTTDASKYTDGSKTNSKSSRTVVPMVKQSQV